MEKINIAELLKNCPTGMELDCTMYENLEFDHIDEESIYPIKCRAKITDVGSNSYEFTENGQPNHYSNAKCVIFPKGKTSWEGFIPLKEGDVVISTYGDIHLLCTEDSSHCSYRHRRKNKLDNTMTTGITVDRLATEEEKQLLFDAIKDNGYKWNEATKTLDKLIEPLFKVGDRIKLKGGDEFGIITQVLDCFYIIKNKNHTHYWSIKKQDDWELAPDKFDINTLKPFDQVLVREDNKKLWRIHFFERLNNILKDRFVCLGGYRYHQCVPYEGNEHLLNTSNEPDNFYITW